VKGCDRLEIGRCIYFANIHRRKDMVLDKQYTLPLGIEEAIADLMTKKIGKPVTVVENINNVYTSPTDVTSMYGFLLECEGDRGFILASDREIGMQETGEHVRDLFLVKAEQLAQSFLEKTHVNVDTQEEGHGRLSENDIRCD
jgi:hypothetical protein|tara:strand:+ start:1181 stop:1609 length:429 start_codon:yes stop_codon:yes gene_type:complete